MEDIRVNRTVEVRHKYEFYEGDAKAGHVVLVENLYEQNHLLTDVWTKREYRGRGIARQLIERVIKDYGDTRIILTVHPFSDKPLTEGQLLNFYWSLGFRTYGDKNLLNMYRPANGEVDDEFPVGGD